MFLTPAGWCRFSQVGGEVSSLDESLRRILAVEGVRSAALIDLATGMVVRSAGAEPATLPEAAARLAGGVRAGEQARGTRRRRPAPGPARPRRHAGRARPPPPRPAAPDQGAGPRAAGRGSAAVRR